MALSMIALGSGACVLGPAEDGEAAQTTGIDASQLPDTTQSSATDASSRCGDFEPSSDLTLIELTVDPDVLDELLADEDRDLEVATVACVNGRQFEPVELELHGKAARRFPKRSFRIKFPDEDKVASDVFGVEGQRYHRWVLSASWVDASFLRNALTLKLSREQGLHSPRTGFAELRINGEFYGLYVVIERTDRQFMKRQGFNPDGNLYKASNHSANWLAKPDAREGYEHKVQQDQGEDLQELLQAIFETPAVYEDFEARVAPLLDLQDVMIWHMVHTFAMDLDTFTKNYYLHHDIEAELSAPDSGFRVIPWDADATWGNAWTGSPKSPTGTKYYGGQMSAYDDVPRRGADALSPKLMSIDRYRSEYVQLYLDTLTSAFRYEALEPVVEAWSERVRDLAVADLAKWQPELDYDAEVERLLDAIATRHDVMSEVLAGVEVDGHGAGG